MRVTDVKNAISFKSGYPTFGGAGHLSHHIEEPYIYPGYLYKLPDPSGKRPSGGILKLDYLA